VSSSNLGNTKRRQKRKAARCSSPCRIGAKSKSARAISLFVVGPEGDNQLVNYRVRGNYYIVDRLFAAAELRLGEKPQQVVRISRTDTVAANGSRRGGEP
jgi:hypothetical protein